MFAEIEMGETKIGHLVDICILLAGIWLFFFFTVVYKYKV